MPDSIDNSWDIDNSLVLRANKPYAQNETHMHYVHTHTCIFKKTSLMCNCNYTALFTGAASSNQRLNASPRNILVGVQPPPYTKRPTHSSRKTHIGEGKPSEKKKRDRVPLVWAEKVAGVVVSARGREKQRMTRQMEEVRSSPPKNGIRLF